MKRMYRSEGRWYVYCPLPLFQFMRDFWSGEYCWHRFVITRTPNGWNLILFPCPGEGILNRERYPDPYAPATARWNARQLNAAA
jgi:hypothetical protein